MTYCILDYSKHYRVDFVTYTDTHDDSPTTNTMAERSQGDIYLVPNKKFQGGFKFIILRTGKIITRKQFTPLPMPQSVINQLEEMAIKKYLNEGLIFTGRNGNTLKLYKNDVSTHYVTA